MANEIISRRDFLSIMGIGSSAILVNAYSPLLKNKTLKTGNKPDIELAIRATPGQVQILGGQKTNVWHYEGEVIKGPKGALQFMPGSYLGPIIRAHQGQTLRVHFTNQISEPSIIHWHGLHVPESADGHPKIAIDQGETYTYDFKILNRAGTYWYHPHPHGYTGPQVMYGLAGLFIVSDDEEERLALPANEFDLPLVIQDRTFDGNNQFVYEPDADKIMGFYGDRIMINGFPDFTMPVAANPYRLRILNGSNARIYSLAWRDGRPLTVIGTDGGLLESPTERDYLVLSPAERVDLWVDFSNNKTGDQLQLVRKDPLSKNGEGEPLATFAVDRGPESHFTLPKILSSLSLNDEKDAVNLNRPRQFTLSMGKHMQWFMNDKQFDMTEVDANETVRLGDLEVWEFINVAESGMGAIPHPIHIHGLQFQVINRESDAKHRETNRIVNEGLVDNGWKDTVLVMPGERVRVLLKFEDFEGLFLYHCHNLEHEDMGMMRNYLVKA